MYFNNRTECYCYPMHACKLHGNGYILSTYHWTGPVPCCGSQELTFGCSPCEDTIQEAADPKKLFSFL